MKLNNLVCEPVHNALAFREPIQVHNPAEFRVMSFSKGGTYLGTVTYTHHSVFHKIQSELVQDGTTHNGRVTNAINAENFRSIPGLGLLDINKAHQLALQKLYKVKT
jgi:hypothetical protein